MFLKTLALVIFTLFFSACGEEKDPMEENSYNALFVYPPPDEKRVYVGTVKGLSSCKYIVSQYYTDRRKYIKGKWDYVCCLRTKENKCLEEHRYNE